MRQRPTLGRKTTPYYQARIWWENNFRKIHEYMHDNYLWYL